MSEIDTTKVDAMIRFLQRLREGCYVKLNDNDLLQVFRLDDSGYIESTYDYNINIPHWESCYIDVDDLFWYVSQYGFTIVYRPNQPASQSSGQSTHIRRVEL